MAETEGFEITPMTIEPNSNRMIPRILTSPTYSWIRSAGFDSWQKRGECSARNQVAALALQSRDLETTDVASTIISTASIMPYRSRKMSRISSTVSAVL